MFIRRIQFRNVASYGDKIQEISFEDFSSFFLLVGANGTGKTTLSQVIKLGLYGKTGDGRKIKDIANRINKNAWIKIDLETKIGTVTVERGFEPTFLNLYINDKEYDQAGKKEVQSYLEEEILEIPFYVFNNIISISINDFKSFLRMTPHDKKLIIDKIFGLSIINLMRDFIKNEIRNIKDFLDKLDGRVSTLVSNIDSSISELDFLNEKIIKDSNIKKTELETNKFKLEELKIKIEENIKDLISKDKQILEYKHKIKDFIQAEKITIRDIEEKEKLYANEKCPLCTSDLHTEYHQHIIHGFLELKEKSIKALEEHKQNLSKIDEKEKLVKTQKNEIIEKLKNIEVKIRVIDQSLKELSNNNSDQTESLDKLITKLKDQLKESKNKQYTLQKKNNYLNIIDEILGDKGIKHKAIKTILPALNTEIFNLMHIMHLDDYKVVFDEEFNANITHFGYEVNASTLSFGESKKVDFAVLISIIKLMKLKFPSINLLFLDEIFSSLDSDSRHTVLQILKKVVSELNLNTFVINHSEMPEEVFDYKIQIEKNNHFSQFDIIKS